MTECCVMSKASSTPACAIFAPPAPKNLGFRISDFGLDANSCRSAFTSSAASKSPLGSPAMSMNEGDLLGLPISVGEIIPGQMEEYRRGKADGVDSIQHAAVAFDHLAVILHATVPFDGG